jgi:hypothetical protein
MGLWSTCLGQDPGLSSHSYQFSRYKGAQTFSSILMDLSPCLCLLHVLDIGMPIALQRPVAAGRVRLQRTAGLDSEVSRLLRCLHGDIAGHLDDDRALATEPGDDGWPVFVIRAAERLRVL